VRIDSWRTSVRRRGFSLAELLIAVSILGVLVLLVVPRISQNSAASRRNACYTLKGNIEIQAQLWYRQKAEWPVPDLSDIATDPSYFPDGLLNCPVDGTAYVLDPTTHRVSGHTH
jgi:prepilin-type N-terminal cleavage/methylation domain-containing protein